MTASKLTTTASSVVRTATRLGVEENDAYVDGYWISSQVPSDIVIRLDQLPLLAEDPRWR